MDYSINLTIQLLLGADDGRYDEELVSMAEKIFDDDTNEVEKHFDDSDDDSIANESCHI
jgi:DNA polymerase III delta subunit